MIFWNVFENFKYFHYIILKIIILEKTQKFYNLFILEILMLLQATTQISKSPQGELISITCQSTIC